MWLLFMKPKVIHEFVLIEEPHGSGQAAGLMLGHHIESGTGGTAARSGDSVT